MQNDISNKRSQYGMTVYAMMLVMVAIGFTATVLVKLGPLYLSNNVVKNAMSGIHDEYAGANMNDIQDGDIRSKVQKYFQVNMVDPEVENSVKITRVKDKVILSFNYEIRRPFMSNVDTVVVFTNEVDLAH